MRIIILVAILLNLGCTKETITPTYPECKMIYIQPYGDSLVIWRYENVLVFHNDMFISNWCKRDKDLRIVNDGIVSAIIPNLVSNIICVISGIYPEYDCCSIF